MKAALLILFVVLAAPSTLGAQEVAAGTNNSEPETVQPESEQKTNLVQEVSPTGAMKVGDPITLTLALTHPIDSDVLLPAEFGSERFQLVAKETTTEPSESGHRSTLTLTFALFRPGSFTLPSFDVTILQRDGSSEIVKTAPFEVKALDGIAQVKDPAFKEPRPPVEIWVEDLTLAWAGGIGLGAFLIGAFGFFFWNRREVIVIPPPPRSPHEIALEKLSGVAGDNLIERDEHMIFYVRVSEAIREYMGNVHKFPGTELTTTEILEELRPKFFPRGMSQDDVGDFLHETDLVKFGGIVPSVEDADRILRRAFTIVELTRMPTAGSTKTPTESSAEEPESARRESAWAPKFEEEE